MATAGDGRSPYGSGGAGGKFRKRPFRRSTQATPYDRPPTALRNNNPGLLMKLVDPASKLIYAGAHRLFGVFRKRLPYLSLQGPPEVNEGPQDISQEVGRNTCAEVSEHSAREGGNPASISAATGMSELEQMLKQKTFTRSEIERLTALLHSRTIESTSDDGNGAKPSSSPSLLRLESFTGSLRKDGNEKDSFRAAITTPVVSSRIHKEKMASPADLDKAYMGSRPMKTAPSGLGSSTQEPRQDMKLLNDASGIPTTPVTSVVPKTANSFRGPENGFLTPRSRGRSAMYSMARTPYSRGSSAFTPKGIVADYGHSAALTSSQSAWGHEGKMALKRRSSVLEDDIGSGGPLRRIRQKANLLSQRSSLSRDKRELGYTSMQQDTASQNLLLINGPDSKVTKGVEGNADTSLRGSGFASVPTKSTQMATKILEQLERLSPKEKNSRSTSVGTREKAPSKLTLDMLHGQALRSLEKVDSPKYLPSPDETRKSEVQQHVRLHDSRALTSQSKDKVEENVSRKFSIPRNMVTTVNGDSADSLKDNASIVTTDSISKLPIAEPPQKKHAFQMSAPEDLLEVDDDIHVNGHVSFPLLETTKPEASSMINKHVSAEEVQTPSLPEISKTPLLVELTPALPVATKISEQAELKEGDNAISSSKADVGLFGGSVREQGIGFPFPISPPSTTITQTGLLAQPALQMDKVSPEKELPEKESPNAFSLFGTDTEKVSRLKFSSNGSSEFKPDASSDPKALNSTSVFSSYTKNDQIKFSMTKNDENGNDQKSANIFGKSESLASAVSAATSSSGIFSFGSSTTTTPNKTAASSPPLNSSMASFPASGANMNSLFNNSSSNVTSASTTTVISSTTTTAASSTIFSTSVPSPVFSFGSATSNLASTAASTSMIETGNTNVTDEKEPKSNITSSPFASTSFATTTTGNSLFGFSSPAVATTTTNNQSQGSFFNVSSGPQANTQAVSFQFGSSSSLPSGSTSGSSLFGGSAPAFGSSPSFGLGSVAASSETKSGNSTSGSATSIFGSASSAWPSPQTSGFGSTFSSPSPVFSFGASTSMPSASSSPIMFGSSNTGASRGSSMFPFSTAGATNSSFGTPSLGQSVFGNSTPVFGAVTASTNNNDHMSMEDSMAEDSMQTPSPVSPFGQAPAAAPGFMFGPATPNPTQATVPFQFGGQTNQAPTQNHFQSSSVEFNAGGSFSLGSGGDKSGRRIVRVKNKNRRK